MAKKTKRKVSSGMGRATSSDSAAVIEAPVAPVTPAVTPARSAQGLSYAARRSAAAAISEFAPDDTYVVHDLRRIGILAGSFVVILIILSFILPQFL